MVVTTVLFITKVGFEIAAEGFILRFCDFNLPLNPILTDSEDKMFRRSIKLIVERVMKRVAVNGNERRPHPQTQPLRG